jgi:antitoxin PrlF
MRRAAAAGAWSLHPVRNLTYSKDMPTATLTTKGQLTLPKRVRELLRLDAGDLVEFIISPDGTVQVRAGSFDVRELRGMLKKPGRKAVSLEEMDEAIARGRAHRP